jgi:DNA-binding NtrC family response regulator
MQQTKPHLLFVDDEVQILNTMKALFRRHFLVSVATSGFAALKMLKDKETHVLVSDQRMPNMEGIDLLRMAKKVSPHTMRILLTGYADYKAVIGSINEGEVFRFINKPWDNDRLVKTVAQAAEIALRAFRESLTQPGEHEHVSGVLAIDSDPDTHALLRAILAKRYPLFFAKSSEEALQILEQEEIGIVMSDMVVGGADLTTFLKTLKRHHPHIVTTVMTEREDAMSVIDLINQGQVYRLLTKPVKPGICKLIVQASMRQHAAYVSAPQLTRRVQVEQAPPQEQAAIQSGTLVSRIKALRNRFRGAQD